MNNQQTSSNNSQLQKAILKDLEWEFEIFKRKIKRIMQKDREKPIPVEQKQQTNSSHPLCNHNADNNNDDDSNDNFDSDDYCIDCQKQQTIEERRSQGLQLLKDLVEHGYKRKFKAKRASISDFHKWVYRKC